MNERLKFVARLLDGEKMAVVCRELGISRKSGYKVFNRYKDYGPRGLENRARRPKPCKLAKAGCYRAEWRVNSSSCDRRGRLRAG